MFASSHESCKVFDPSKNYIELIQYNSTKSGLLLLTTVIAREGVSFWAQPNILSNVMKGFLCAQSVIFPEGLNPFEIPSTPSNQSLSQFNIKTSFFVNGHKFHSSSNDLDSSYGKDGKLGYIMPTKIE